MYVKKHLKGKIITINLRALSNFFFEISSNNDVNKMLEALEIILTEIQCKKKDFLLEKINFFHGSGIRTKSIW